MDKADYPRDLRTDAIERIVAKGNALVPLCASSLEYSVGCLLGNVDEAVAAQFLHSYSNFVRELWAGEILGELWPKKYVTLGHSLLAEGRETERGETAAVNASVQLLRERYINRLSHRLRRRRFRNDLLVVNGNGGIVSSRKVAAEAAKATKATMSGPSSGVMAVALSGPLVGMPALMSYYIVGTSTDVALIDIAEPSVSDATELE